MHKLHVLSIVGTRPEIIRLCRVLAKLDKCTNHTLVHTGQNYDYELNQIFFEELGVRKPDYFLGAAGKNAAETIGKIIISIDEVLEKEKPEAVLILGDTNSCLSAIAAKRRRIPIFHMEAGNRSFDMRVPEEINRRLVDHVADVNLTYSDIAREYLLSEGLPADRIIKTGSPMKEVLMHYMTMIQSSNVLERLNLVSKKYFVVSVHREENIDSRKNLIKLVEALNAIAEQYGEPIVVSTHPRTKNRFNSEGVIFNPLVKLMKPFGFIDYIKLQIDSRAVISDSGTITEESSILNFPALNIREAHERPEGMEEGAVMMVGVDPNRILQALEVLEVQSKEDYKMITLPVADYESPNVSDKVVRIILSYTDYVKRVVWKEY